MGNSDVSKKVVLENTSESCILFNPDWFDIWLSLKGLMDFDKDDCCTVGFRLILYRVINKCKEKVNAYIMRMCKDRSTQ